MVAAACANAGSDEALHGLLADVDMAVGVDPADAPAVRVLARQRLEARQLPGQQSDDRGRARHDTQESTHPARYRDRPPPNHSAGVLTSCTGGVFGSIAPPQPRGTYRGDGRGRHARSTTGPARQGRGRPVLISVVDQRSRDASASHPGQQPAIRAGLPRRSARTRPRSSTRRPSSRGRSTYRSPSMATRSTSPSRRIQARRRGR